MTEMTKNRKTVNPPHQARRPLLTPCLVVALVLAGQAGPAAGKAAGRADPAPAGEARALARPNFLVDAEGRAVYVFSADVRGADGRAPSSNCGGGCALEWPPVTTEQEPGAEGEASDALIATLRRGDGRLQVTYNGWPLYYYAEDRARARAAGADRAAFGGTWRLITPDGRVVEGRPPAF